MKAEKWLFECRNLEEKYELVTKEKEVRLKSHVQAPPPPAHRSIAQSPGSQPCLKWHLAPCPTSGCWQSGTPCGRPMRNCAAPSCSLGG